MTLNGDNNGARIKVPEEPHALKFIETRHCTRDFDSSRAVPKECVQAVIRAAANAPSSQNNQPWSLHVLEGSHRDALSEALLRAFDEGTPKKGDYQSCPIPLPESLKEGVDTYGRDFFEGHLKISREDKEARQRKYRHNYEFWGAPVHILVCGSCRGGHGYKCSTWVFSLRISYWDSTCMDLVLFLSIPLRDTRLQ